MNRTTINSIACSLWVIAFLLGKSGVADDGDATVVSVSPDLSNTSDVLDASGQSDVWELSTRHLPELPSSINFTNPGFRALHYIGNRWERNTVESALDFGDRLPILYVHGNFMERNNALQRVLIINAYLKKRAQRPYRLILLSWPSQKESPVLHDIRDNAIVAERQSLYLAWLLERLGQQPQVSLLGFSYGARSVTGALHLVSGGSLCGMRHLNIPDAGDAQSIYRVGLVAPAIDRNWMTRNGRHREAMDRVDVLINLYNSQDPILKRFRLLDRVTRPVAAGFAGFTGIENFSNPPATEPLAVQSRVMQFDCGPCVGNTHDERTYYGKCSHFATLLDSLLWNETLESCLAQ